LAPQRGLFFLDALDGRVKVRIVSESKSRSRPTQTAEELAARWAKIEKLPPSEAEAFAKDIEESRRKLDKADKRFRKKASGKKGKEQK
jgi:hypothetical protein